MARSAYSNAWLYLHLAFKAIQGAALVTAIASAGWSFGSYERVMACEDLSTRYGVFVILLIELVQTSSLAEQTPTRAEKLARNWRQVLVDIFSFVGLVAGVFFLPGTFSLFAKAGFGAALGTAAYILLMPVLPLYDSAKVPDIAKHKATNPPGLSIPQVGFVVVSLWVLAGTWIYLTN